MVSWIFVLQCTHSPLLPRFRIPFARICNTDPVSSLLVAERKTRFTDFLVTVPLKVQRWAAASSFKREYRVRTLKQDKFRSIFPTTPSVILLEVAIFVPESQKPLVNSPNIRVVSMLYRSADDNRRAEIIESIRADRPPVEGIRFFGYVRSNDGVASYNALDESGEGFANSARRTH